MLGHMAPLEQLNTDLSRDTKGFGLNGLLRPMRWSLGEAVRDKVQDNVVLHVRLESREDEIESSCRIGDLLDEVIAVSDKAGFSDANQCCVAWSLHKKPLHSS